MVKLLLAKDGVNPHPYLTMPNNSERKKRATNRSQWFGGCKIIPDISFVPSSVA